MKKNIGVLLCVLALPVAAQETVLYVSGQGNDAWSGRLAEPNAARNDGPFATLGKARDALREARKQGRLKGSATVLVRNGTYLLEQPLVFGPEDSGTAAAPVTFAAYRGENPVISGGRRIQGWKRAEGEQRPRGAGVLWQAEIPQARDGQWNFRQLWINGERRQRARTPTEGFFYTDGAIKADGKTSFAYNKGDVSLKWGKQDGAEAVILTKWTVIRSPIQKVDAAVRTVTLASPHPVPNYLESRARYWLENTRDALDAPGEWYLDRRAGILYYRQMPEEDMARVEAIAPVPQYLVKFEAPVMEGKAVEYIRLRGFTFMYTDWSMGPNGQADPQAAFSVPAAIEAVGANSCSVERCVFRHIGQYAVEFGTGCKKNRVVGNEMSDLGAGGVKIGLGLRIVQRMKVVPPRIMEVLQDEKRASSDNVVSDNRISDIGRVYPDAVGIWVGQSPRNLISHNEIHDTYYSGISVGWTWGFLPTAARDNIIEFNHIYNVGRGLMSDMGCIYTVGIQPGTTVRNNLCHDVDRYEYGGWGLYIDDASSQILVENNVVYRTRDGGYHNQYGQQNVVRNNIFALGRRAQILRTRLAPEISFTFERNIVYWKEGVLATGGTPDEGLWEQGKVKFDSNLYFHAAGKPVRFGPLSFEEWRKRGQDAHSLVANPLFVDPKHGNFKLKPGSPALKLGFKPIDLSTVGPRAQEGRK